MTFFYIEKCCFGKQLSIMEIIVNLHQKIVNIFHISTINYSPLKSDPHFLDEESEIKQHHKLESNKISSKQILFMFAVLIGTILTLGFKFFISRGEFSDYLVKTNVVKPKKILIWTSFFGTSWIKKIDHLNQSQCNCQFSEDHSQLDDSDAVIFHWRDIGEIPNKKKVNQKFIWFLEESPENTGNEKKLLQNGNQFDCTASYRQDSHIYLPYGQLIASKSSLNWFTISHHQKRKSVAWLVSDCNTASKREYYVKMLKKWVTIKANICNLLMWLLIFSLIMMQIY